MCNHDQDPAAEAYRVSACSGALAAAVIGAATQASSIRAPATLFAFFLSSSKLTGLKEELKSGTDEFKAGGQRDWKQVCTYHLSLISPG